MDRVRNEEVRSTPGIERELASRMDQRVLRWFGYVERMNKYHMTNCVLMAEVNGVRVQDRPRLVSRGMRVGAARQCGEPWCSCGTMWRALVQLRDNVGSLGADVDDSASCSHFCFVPVFLNLPSTIL